MVSDQNDFSIRRVRSLVAITNLMGLALDPPGP